MAHRQPQSRQADRKIDQENAAPAKRCDQRPADERARCDRKACTGRPDPHRARPLVVVAIRMIEHRERIGHEDRCADSLRGARGDEDRQRGRTRACERSDREYRKARDENALTAEAIAQRPGSQDERRERDRVGTDDPLQRDYAAAQRGRNGVQRRVDDRDVELNNGEAQAGCRKGQ